MKRFWAVVFSFVACAQPLFAEPVLQIPSGITGEGSGNRAGYSTPAVAELDGDSTNGKEIVAASLNGIITAVHADGSPLWEVTAPNSGCGGPASIHSSPAIGALYGDGVPYVVIGYGPIAKRCQGGVLAIHGPTGKIAWRFSTKNFARREKFWAILHTVFSSPALADVDGDGKLEIGFGSFDRNVYLLNYNGSVRWYYHAADTVWSSATFANIDATPQLEMIIGTDISANNKINPITKNGGNLYAFKTAATTRKRYNFRDPRIFVWMKPVEQVLFSTPTVGEVIPQNAGLEVVINSGCYFPERTASKIGRWTRVFSARTGKILRTLPLETCSSSRPALADINGDGEAEIFTTVNGSQTVGGDGLSRLKAFDGATGSLLWTIIPQFRGRNYQWGGNFISPIVTDLFKDGSQKVIVPVANGIGMYDAATGAALTCETSSCEAEGLAATSLRTADILLNSATIADINGDDSLDIVAAGKSSSGKLGIFAWTFQ